MLSWHFDTAAFDKQKHESSIKILGTITQEFPNIVEN